MTESEVRSLICRNINDSHHDCHAVSIESPETCPGFPDINMVLKAIELNMELKTVTKVGRMYSVQAPQISFVKRRANAAGIVLWMMVVQHPYEVLVTLGCPHEESGKFTWNDKTREIWTGAKTGCVVLEGKPTDWAKAIFGAAQTLAP